MKKSTDELLKILEGEDELDSFIDENNDEFLEMSLSEYLEAMLLKYNAVKNDVINASGINQIYGYQLFSGVKQNPSRDKLIQLIFGLKLSLKDAERLLKLGGVSELYPRVKRDSIILYALANSYSLEKCDELLFEYGEETILKD